MTTKQAGKNQLHAPIPKAIKTAEYLIYASLIIGFLKSILYEALTAQNMLSEPMNLTIAIVTILLIGFLGFKIGKGKNWARITLLVFFALGLIAFPFIVINEFHMNPIIGIISLIQAAIQLYVLIILFTGVSKNWFSKQQKYTPVEHE